MSRTYKPKSQTTLGDFFTHNDKYKYNPYSKQTKRNNNTIRNNNLAYNNTNKTKNPTQTPLRRYQTTNTGSYGTKIQAHPSTHTRIIFMNVNGIETNSSDKIKEIADYMNTHQIHICCLAETNIHWKNNQIFSNILKRFRAAMNDRKAYLTTSDTNVSWSRTYKPGGTATITTQLISDQTTSRFYDNPY